MPEPAPIEIHKALADDTRYRLYRYLRLSGRPVPVRELSTRLSLHPNTLRPHLRRLEEAGLVGERGPPRRDRRATAGRCTRRSTARSGRAGTTGSSARSWRAFSTNKRQRERRRRSRANGAPTWSGGASPARAPAARPGPNLAVLQEALAEAGFDPRFRRRSAKTVEISLRDCPFRDLLEEHRELVCAVHKGLLEGMLGASRPVAADDRVRAAGRTIRGVPAGRPGRLKVPARRGFFRAPD